jgi:Uma2 family endonuclease
MGQEMVKTEAKRWTYEDYLKLPDEKRYEIINGELFMVPAPNLSHQDISRNLEYLMWNYVREKNLGVVYDAPVDVVLSEENVFQPDIVFVSRDNFGILKEKAIFGAPDLVVEIISPSSIYNDMNVKKEIYEKFGVKEYWIVDPANKAIQIFTLEGGKFKLHFFGYETGKASSKIIQGFEVELEEIFKSVI